MLLEATKLRTYDICRYCRLAVKRIPRSEGLEVGVGVGGICNQTPAQELLTGKVDLLC